MIYHDRFKNKIYPTYTKASSVVLGCVPPFIRINPFVDRECSLMVSVKTPGVVPLLIYCALASIALAVGVVLLVIWKKQLDDCKNNQSVNCFDYICPDGAPAKRSSSAA